MEDTTISIVAIIISAVIMFMVPLMLISDRSDDIAQLTSQAVTSQFVDKVIKTGKISNDDYFDFRNMLATTGNIYDVDMELKVLDFNSAKRQTLETNGIGQNTYYSIFATQIEEKLYKIDLEDDGMANNSGELILKEGDRFSILVKNRSLTLSQSLKNIYYRIRGESIHIIAATESGTVAVNGER